MNERKFLISLFLFGSLLVCLPILGIKAFYLQEERTQKLAFVESYASGVVLGAVDGPSLRRSPSKSKEECDVKGGYCTYSTGCKKGYYLSKEEGLCKTSWFFRLILPRRKYCCLPRSPAPVPSPVPSPRPTRVPIPGPTRAEKCPSGSICFYGRSRCPPVWKKTGVCEYGGGTYGGKGLIPPGVGVCCRKTGVEPTHSVPTGGPQPTFIPSPTPSFAPIPTGVEPTHSVPTGGPQPTFIPSPTPSFAPIPTGVQLCTVCQTVGDRSKGDANCDGVVNILDFSAWRLEKFDQKADRTQKKTWRADFNCDGYVKADDFSIWLHNLE